MIPRYGLFYRFCCLTWLEGRYIYVMMYCGMFCFEAVRGEGEEISLQSKVRCMLSAVVMSCGRLGLGV